MSVRGFINALFLILVIFVLAGCSKDNISDPPDNDPPDNDPPPQTKPAEVNWNKPEESPVLERDYFWESDGIGIPSVIFDGNTYHMWYTGLTGGSGFLGGRIGYATSPDGKDWTKYADTPVMESGPFDTWDDAGVMSPTVIKTDTGYKMWYCGIDGLHSKIGYATSSDGVHWTKHSGNPIVFTTSENSFSKVAVGAIPVHPCVRYVGDTYMMWFSSANSIQLATSTDGIAWTLHPDTPVLTRGDNESWEGVSVLDPSVHFDGATYHMWYTGYSNTLGTDMQIGYASSMDGINWTKYENNPILGTAEASGWDQAYNGYATVIPSSDGYHMWYSASHNSLAATKFQVGFATASGQ